MSYYYVPIIVDQVTGSNELDIDYHTLISGVHFSNSQAIVWLKDGVEVRTSWTPATLDDWNLHSKGTADPLDLIKIAKIAELEQAFKDSFTTFTSNALGVTKTYPITEDAQSNMDLLESRLMANPNKDVFAFYTFEDKNLVDHTRAQFLQLLDDAEAVKVAHYRKKNDLQNQVSAIAVSSTVTEQQAIDQVKAIVWT